MPQDATTRGWRPPPAVLTALQAAALVFAVLLAGSVLGRVLGGVLWAPPLWAAWVYRKPWKTALAGAVVIGMALDALTHAPLGINTAVLGAALAGGHWLSPGRGKRWELPHLIFVLAATLSALFFLTLAGWSLPGLFGPVPRWPVWGQTLTAVIVGFIAYLLGAWLWKGGRSLRKSRKSGRRRKARKA
ncbi:MAG: hypothetical protein RLY93_06715 [Sumerlaeia bacterium]